MKTRLALLGFSVLLMISEIVFPGCATMTGGASKPIVVSSKQKRASVFIDGKLRGTAPLTTSVSRWGTHRIRIEAPGRKPCEFRLEKHYNQIVNNNVLVGIAPAAIDLVSGAAIEQSIPHDVLKSNGREVIQIHPQEFFGATLSFTVDLEPLPPVAGRR